MFRKKKSFTESPYWRVRHGEPQRLAGISDQKDSLLSRFLGGLKTNKNAPLTQSSPSANTPGSGTIGAILINGGVKPNPLRKTSVGMIGWNSKGTDPWERNKSDPPGGRCPSCRSRSVYHRNTKAYTYRCRRCGNEFN